MTQFNCLLILYVSAHDSNSQKREPDHFGLAYLWSPVTDSSLESGTVPEGQLPPKNEFWEGSRNKRITGYTTYTHALLSINTI